MLTHLSLPLVQEYLTKAKEYMFHEKYCNLSAVAKFSMRDVDVLFDRESLRNGTEPNYLMVRYQGNFIATVFEDTLLRVPHSFLGENEREKVSEIYRLLESYYS